MKRKHVNKFNHPITNIFVELNQEQRTWRVEKTSWKDNDKGYTRGNARLSISNVSNVLPVNSEHAITLYHTSQLTLGLLYIR